MPHSCQYWIDKFREDYLQRGSSETTWKTDYQKILNRLPSKKPMTAALLHEIVLTTPVNTKTRKRACMVCGAIARFSGIKYDPSPYSGKYSPKKVTPRQIPPDDLLLEQYDRLTNPGWKWFFGMMATYGLRPHEVFRLELDELREGNPVIQVQRRTKTGERPVWAFHPYWFEQFNLSSVTIPPIDLTRPNIKLGESACRYFREFGLPFHLYDMRHRWAIRATVDYKLDYKVAAKMMGHSYQVHETIYHRWIDVDAIQREYDRVTRKNDF
jgi:integrase